MADKVIDIPGVGPITFPDSMSEDDMNKEAARLYTEHQGQTNDAEPNQPQGAANPRNPGVGLTLAAIRGGLPLLGNVAERVATNPNIPKVFATVGRVTGAVAPAIAGAVAGGPIGALVGLNAASKSSWAGGKTGYFTGRMIQDAAAPVANAVEKAEPITKGALSPLAAVQSFLDLAQIAEPNRKDIGTLGVTIGPRRTDAEKAANPALLNAMADAFVSSMKKAPVTWQSLMDAVKSRIK